MNSIAHPLQRLASLAAMAFVLFSPLAAAAAETSIASLESLPMLAKASLVLTPMDPAYRLGPKTRSPRISQPTVQEAVVIKTSPVQPQSVKRTPAATVYNVGL